MSLHDRIKEARKNKGITQEQLGSLIGVAKTTITGYEKNREPTAAKVGEIADALDVDANFLYQDEMRELKHKDKTTIEEFEHIKKYRDLDDHGREMVDFTLQKEWERSIKDNCKTTEATIYNFKNNDAIFVAEDSCPYSVNAAHERTDISYTDEERQADEDMLD